MLVDRHDALQGMFRLLTRFQVAVEPEHVKAMISCERASERALSGRHITDTGDLLAQRFFRREGQYYCGKSDTEVALLQLSAPEN